MSDHNMECETCGGNEFYKDSGYFYCKECQTQSQEAREHVFQDEPTHVNTKSSRKIKKQEEKHDKVTSWECYNVIMHSLTQQLINLGAERSLKPVVKCLWIRYLEKLEVLHLTYNTKPKLQLLHNKKDLGIIYGITKRKKRKRKHSSTSGTNSLTSGATSHQTQSSLKRERTKKKTALAKAEYEQYSQKSSQEGTSLHNETLSSLKRGSDKSSILDTTLNYSLYSVRELKKSMSQRHYQKHRKDPAGDLNCHKQTYRSCSATYKHGIHYLSPVKMYSVLYLGLLINRDKIQLGDFLRFIREGHLSFNNYTNLFPESYSNKYLNVGNNSKNQYFNNRWFRQTSNKLAQFLGVISYVEVPDLMELADRFCREMNLPDAVLKAVNNLLSKTAPKLKFSSQCKIIPNYEGRIMSMILFTLKLLFGLDGVTEFHLSKYAQLINNKLDDSDMFDIVKWMEYICHRTLIMNQQHLPTSHINDCEVDSDLFLQYIKSHNIVLENETHLTKEMKDYKSVLEKIRDKQYDHLNNLGFPPSLTPFLSYSKLLTDLGVVKNMPRNILQDDFHWQSIDFLMRPNKYLQLLNSPVVKNRGANKNWEICDVKTRRNVRRNGGKVDHNLISLRIVERGSDKHIDEVLKESDDETENVHYDSDYMQKQYHMSRRHIFSKNALYLERVSGEVNIPIVNEEGKEDFDETYEVHYNPYERYWLYLQMGLDMLTKGEFDKFFSVHTKTFKLIVKECARIIEQTPQEFFTEFHSTELFLVYSANYCKPSDDFKPRRWLTGNLDYYVNQAESNW